MFEFGHMVQRKGHPESFGVIVEKLHDGHVRVSWLVGGREAQKNHKWGVTDPKFEEECLPADIELTYCPACGEDTCWCGVGR